MNFIEKQKQLEKIIAKYQDIIGNEAQELSTSLALQTSDKNLEAIKQMEEENRLLQIGIIGRVKAGKSTLLNALLFDGKSVLPKAATPMTAALTILSYGEKLSAEVEFFTTSDIENIKIEYNRYKYEKNRLVEKYKEELKTKRQEKLSKINKLKEKVTRTKLSDKEENEIIEKAEKRANHDLKSQISLVASFEQYEKIKASGISIDKLKSINSKIEAKNYSELGKKLLDYVAVGGKYMPFTKSVHIKLPNENLKDIQIVDTPGINDPVRSREERTRELLKFCDVVLIVSPSGQFLSSQDTELMDRITSKEGVRELYVVASQVDNQLSGSIKRDSDGDLHRALNLIVSQLSEHMNSTLTKLKSDSPEIGSTYDQLIELSREKIIYSSGISQTIASFWDDRKEWDGGTETAWNNLKRHYPDYFSDNDKQLSLSNLEKLSNIPEIYSIIENVRAQKDSILAKRKEEFLSAKMETLMDYKNEMIKFAEQRLKDVNSNDIKELEEKRVELKDIKNKASVYLDEEYSMLISQLKGGLKVSLTEILDGFFKKAKKDIRNAEDSETETWITRGGFLWLKKIHHSRTFVIVRTGAVRDALESLTSSIEDKIDVKAEKIIYSWRKNTPRELIKAIRTKVDDEYLETYRIIQAFRKVFNEITYPQIIYSGGLPESLYAKGTLKEKKAEDFIDIAQSYVNNLRKRVRNDIDQFLSKLITELSSIKLSEEFFSNYNTLLKELEEQIKNKKIIIDTFNRLISEIKKIDWEGD